MNEQQVAQQLAVQKSVTDESATDRETQQPLRLWQPKQPMYWLWLALCVAMGAYSAVELLSRANGASITAVLAAVLMLLVQAVVLWLVLRVLARFSRQAMSMRVAALVWGLLAAVGLAILANSPYSEPLQGLGLGEFTASLTAPINEDAFRLLGVLTVLILAYSKRITVMDGVVYGFLVGAGFELLENLLYAFDGDTFESVLQNGMQRLIMGFGLHALWTATAGAGLAYCLSRRQRGLGGRWWVLIPAVLVPMALHAAWDAPAISVLAPVVILIYILLYVVTIVVFLIVLRWGRRDEFAWCVARTGTAKSYREFQKLPKVERKRLASEAIAAENAAH